MNTKQKLKAVGLLVLALLSIVFSIVCVSGGLSQRSIGKEKLFALNNGERAVGTIVSDNESTPDSAGGTSFTLVYKFTLPSRAEIQGTYTDADSGFLSDRTPGNSIEIAYNPEKPEVNVPANANYHGAEPFLMFLTMILSPLMGIAFTILFGYFAWQNWKVTS